MHRQLPTKRDVVQQVLRDDALLQCLARRQRHRLGLCRQKQLSRRIRSARLIGYFALVQVFPPVYY